MFFLIAGLLCSASVSIVLKYSSRWNYDRYGMLFINYLSCLVPFLILQKGSSLPPIDKDFGNCLLFAIVNGVLYIAGMLLNQINVKRNGAILQSTFARLGVIVPTFLSIIFFGERPAPGEIIGILAVLAAFIIMNIPEKEGNSRESRKSAFPLLIAGLLFNGAVDSFLKVFQEFGNENLENWFMGMTFLSAAMICLAIVLAGRHRIGRKETIIGICLGIPNYLSSFFLLKSLSLVSAYIAYPTYSVGAIIVVMIASIFIFREKLTKWGFLSLALIIPSLLLLLKES